MYVQTAVFLCLLITLINLKQGFSIRCYDCNSGNNSACMDMAFFERATNDVDKVIELKNYGIKLVDCDLQIPKPVNTKFFCRKMVQTILHPGHDPLIRVTRGCGWVPHHRPCYTADNDDHLETVCQCFQDGCNSAVVLTTSLFKLLVLPIITSFYFII